MRASLAAAIAALAFVGCPEPARDPASAGAATESSVTPSASVADRGPGEKKRARCGVAGAALCAAGYHCMDDPSDSCDPRRAACPGVCEATACGSRAVCASGFDCVDDPADSCKPDDGHVGCAGVCIESRSLVRCGGAAERTCPGGLRCIDDIADACNPKLNPTCPGLCVR